MSQPQYAFFNNGGYLKKIRLVGNGVTFGRRNESTTAKQRTLSNDGKD
jgi:hypothetical protein